MSKNVLIQRAIGVMCVALVCLSVNCANPVRADESFETPPVLKASEILPPELLKSEFHQVLEEVRNDGYLNFYRISSPFGEFEAEGNTMLRIRVQEIEALAELDQLSKTEIFVEAAANSALSSVKALVTIAEDPEGTVEGISGGVKRMFKGFSRKAQDTVDKAQKLLDADKPEESNDADKADVGEQTVKLAEKYLGISGAERRWAEKLGTDPYSSNETLLKAVKEVAAIERMGNFTVKLAPIPSIPGMEYVGAVHHLAWSKDPAELKTLNEENLTGIGIEQDVIETFLEHAWYTPLLQTALVTALSELQGVSDRGLVLEQAVTAQSEVEARFFLQNVLGLVWYHTRKSPLDRMLAGTKLPCAVTHDARQVSVLAVDSFFWTEEIATAAENYTQAYADLPVKQRELWFLSAISAQSRKELTRLGWTVYENAAELIGADDKE